MMSVRILSEVLIIEVRNFVKAVHFTLLSSHNKSIGTNCLLCITEKYIQCSPQV